MQFEGMPLPVWAKFAICIGFDLFDMTIGRLLLGVSIFTDVTNGLIQFGLWGPRGLLAVWEVLDPSEQLDGFVPTNTLIAWAAHKKAQEATQ